MIEKKLVAKGEFLFRRGYSTPEKKYLNPDGTATSRVFKLREKDNGELSVNVVSLTTPQKSIGDSSKFMLFKIASDSVYEIELEPVHKPELDGSNDAHSVIIGMDLEDEIKPGLLARKSIRVYL